MALSRAQWQVLEVRYREGEEEGTLKPSMSMASSSTGFYPSQAAPRPLVAWKSSVAGRGCVLVEDGGGVHHKHHRRLAGASHGDRGAPAPDLLDLDAPTPREIG